MLTIRQRFVCTETFEWTPSQEILSRGDEVAQYLKLIIFLYSFLREMERRFFDERIPPDEFIL